MSEFSDRPFIAGALVGLRAFNVTVGAHGFRASKARLVALVLPWLVGRGTADKVRNTYRDVPTYRTQREAHPLSRQPPALEEGAAS